MEERRLRVLLVEDDEDDYLLTRHMLNEIESPGFDLDWINTFDSGLEAIGRQEHDVVLVDNHLGVRTGLELLQQAMAAGCNTPIIMLTGSANRDMDVEAMGAGAADYLEKDLLNARLLERSIRYAIERRQVEEALARERRLLRTLIDNIPDFIYVKDLGSRFVLNNEASMRGFDRSQDELLGKTDFDVLPPQRAAEHYATEQDIMQSGEAMIQHEELTFERRTGRELWMSTTKVPLRDSQGQVTGIVGISRDISERRQAEEARARLAAIVESSSDAIIGETLEGIITSWNLGAERVYGYRADEAVGQPISMLVPPDLSDELPFILNALRREEPIGHFETVRVRKDGQRIDVSLRVSPINDFSGTLVEVSVIARDITEHNQAKEQRIELELERSKLEMFKRFVGDMSHDLRTPLSIMTTSLYLLRQAITSDRELRHIENLEEQTAHMLKTVEDLLTLSRLEMAASEFRLAPGDLNTLAQLVCGQEQALAAHKRHQLSLSLDASRPVVLLDPAEFAPALRHLVVNALNYTPDGGQITVSTYLDQGRAVFEVRDNGIGISDEDIPRIFERFYRVDKARAINTGGSGLGLTITRRIVEVHGGQIEVESTLAAGSVFRVRLPIPPQ